MDHRSRGEYSRFQWELLCAAWFPCGISTDQRVLSLYRLQEPDKSVLRGLHRCDRGRACGTESRDFSSRRRAFLLRWRFLELVNCSRPVSQEIQIVFVFVNSRIPAAPSSRPKPERLTPPNGKRGSEATIALMKTIPASRSEVKSSCSSGLFVHALAARPNDVSFAISTACSASRTRKMDATGPKTSSRQAGDSRGTLTITVGS